MNSWKYKISSEGRHLREQIQLGNEVEILKHIQHCCKAIVPQLKGKDKEWFSGEYDKLCNTIDIDLDVLSDNPEEICEWGFSDTKDLVNERLRDFYNLCDSCRVWVEI